MHKNRGALTGAAALEEMLDSIGKEGINDHTVAKILTENEIGLRAMLEFFLKKVTPLHV